MPEDNNQFPSQTPPQQPNAPQTPEQVAQLAAVEQEVTTQPQQQQPLQPVVEQSPVEAAAPVESGLGQPKAPNKKKKIIIASIIAGAVLLLGGAAYATYALWYQNPEKVLTDAVSNVIKAKTAIYKGTLAIDSKEAKVRVEFDGKQSGQLNGEGNAKITITSQGKDFKVNGSALVDKDGNFFFKVGNLQALLDEFKTQTGMTESPFDGLIAKIDNKWIRVSADDMAELSADAGKAQKCMTETLKKIENDKAVHDQLVKAYEQNKFIVIDSSLPSRTIDGVDSMGYKLSTNNDKAKKFVEAVNEMQFMKDLQKCDSSFKLDSSDMTSSSKSDTTETVEVSVSRWTHEFTQLKVSGKDKDGTSGEFVLEPTFGKAVTVAAPTDFMTLKQLQAEIEKATEEFSTMMSEQMQASMEASDATSDTMLFDEMDTTTES